MLFDIFKYYIQAKYLCNFKSRSQLEKWQKEQINKHLKFVQKNSVFYKKYNILDWQNIPIINKEIMMSNFDSLNTVGLNKEEALNLAIESEKSRNFTKSIKNITVGLSSGTSGKRGLFVVSPTERAYWTGNILAKVLPKSIFNKCKIALFLRANSNLYTTTKTNRINFCFFDLIKQPDEHLKPLNDYQPDLLVAPPSVLKFLAQAQQKGKLYIKPQKIISAAEVLYDIDKNFISSIFQQTIHQIYQATEGFLATTCKHGNLHLNEDLLFIEEDWLDSAKTRFSPIITDFRRKSQPIIRYKLNDILIASNEICSCGSVFKRIERIEGRSDEIIYLPNNSIKPQLVTIFPDFIIRALMPLDLIDYKIVQISYSELEFYLYEKDKLDNIKSILKDFFTTHNCKIPQICFKDLEHKYFYNKFRRIQSKL